MARKTSTPGKNDILELLERHEGGLQRAEIGDLLEGEAPKRTLIRWLNEYIKEGIIQRTGASRSSRYVFIEKPASSPQWDFQMDESAIQIGRQVGRPLSVRPILGYDSNPLLSYVPGQTWYLNEDQRDRLHHLGKVFTGDQPAGTYARQIYDRLMIDISWASSHLEGNTYSFLDTRLLLEQGKEAEGKDAIETQMILNHKAAIEMLLDEQAHLGFHRNTILNLHAVLSQDLLADYRNEGRLRNHPVNITGSTFIPLAVPQQIEEYFERILETTVSIEDPFEQAFFFLVHIPYLQPFIDVNKRVSRLGCNISFFASNLCPISFMDVPKDAYLSGILGVYEGFGLDLLRAVFIHAYERSARRYKVVKDSLPQPDPFRLKYRFQLMEAVQDLVRGGGLIERAEIDKLDLRHVEEDDLSIFKDAVLENLLNLHEGNITRYRIRLSEYRQWKEAQG